MHIKLIATSFLIIGLSIGYLLGVNSSIIGEVFYYNFGPIPKDFADCKALGYRVVTPAYFTSSFCYARGKVFEVKAQAVPLEQ